MKCKTEQPSVPAYAGRAAVINPVNYHVGRAMNMLLLLLLLLFCCYIIRIAIVMLYVVISAENGGCESAVGLYCGFALR